MSRRLALPTLLACSVATFIGGLAVGYVVWRADRRESPAVEAVPAAARGVSVVPSDHDDHDHHDDHDDHHGDHVDLSAKAVKNLGLRFGLINREPFRKHLHIPALVIEKPGQSGLTVTSPIQGIVREIHKFPGQSLEPGDRLFTVQVTDEALERAQLTLLETLIKTTLTESEIERLEPLAESGAIMGRRKLELEYQLKQLNSEKSARLQELRLRGLSDEQVDRIVTQRELIGEIDVHLEVAPLPPAQTEIGEIETDDPGPVYTIERIDAFPGRAVLKGEELCHVANHFELFLRGEAFELDVPAIRLLNERDWGVAAELGEGDGHERIENPRVTYMDNHVDLQTQTFPFYMSLPNRVVTESRDAQGRLFRSWQFKPGQRAHLFVPVEEWLNQIVLPRDAVVRSGPEAFVFRVEEPGVSPLQRYRKREERLAQVPRRDEFEFEPVPVQILHQDRDRVVIADDGDLKIADLVALNHAYQLFLAWKLQASGGGMAHDHDH